MRIGRPPKIRGTDWEEPLRFLMEKTEWSDGEIRAFLKEQYSFEVGLMTLWDFRRKYTRPQKDDSRSELIGKLEKKGAVLSELRALGVLAQLFQHLAEKAFATQQSLPVVKAGTVKVLNAAIEAWKAYGEARERYGLSPSGKGSTVLMQQLRMQVHGQMPVERAEMTLKQEEQQKKQWLKGVVEEVKVARALGLGEELEKGVSSPIDVQKEANEQ